MRLWLLALLLVAAPLAQGQEKAAQRTAVDLGMLIDPSKPMQIVAEEFEVQRGDHGGDLITFSRNVRATQHMERACGTIIKLEILGDDSGNSGGIQLAGRHFDGDHDIEVVPAVDYRNSRDGELLARIDATELPEAYNPGRGENAHQDYVDRRLEGLSGQQRARIGQLWFEKERLDPNMANRGASFVRIMEYVATNGEETAGGSDANASDKIDNTPEQQ